MDENVKSTCGKKDANADPLENARSAVAHPSYAMPDLLAMRQMTTSQAIERLQKRLCRIRSDDFGLGEAIFFAKSIDRWSRYSHVLAKIREMKKGKITILDIGSGGVGVSILQNSLQKNCAFFLLDIRDDALKNLASPYRIVGDACRLPFRSKAFDLVVSSDTVEHIPKPIRTGFWNEIRRVCKERIIVTCPMQSTNGLFQARRYDALFQSLYEERHCHKDPNTAQHIAAGHPTLEETRTILPYAEIAGFNNCTVWLRHMSLSYRPVAGLLSGLLYYLLWKKSDNRPPFWSAVITSDIGETASSQTLT